jgi:hypothetical protein
LWQYGRVLSLWGNITTAPSARDLKDDNQTGERQHESSVRFLSHGMEPRVIFCHFQRSTRAKTAKARLGNFADWKAESFFIIPLPHCFTSRSSNNDMDSNHRKRQDKTKGTETPSGVEGSAPPAKRCPVKTFILRPNISSPLARPTVPESVAPV